MRAQTANATHGGPGNVRRGLFHTCAQTVSPKGDSPDRLSRFERADQPRFSVSAQGVFSRHACREKISASPLVSTESQKLLDTLLAVSHSLEGRTTMVQFLACNSRGEDTLKFDFDEAWSLTVEPRPQQLREFL